MTVAKIGLAVIFGLTAVHAAPSAATESGLSTTFNVGAVVVDLCRVPNAYRTIKPLDRSYRTQCEAQHAATYAGEQPVSAITRGANGVVTAISLEF